MKLFIVSNRLPLKVCKSDSGEFQFTRSEGGLTTGLESVTGGLEKHWIGWPGIYTDKEDERETITKHLNTFNYHPVFLEPDQIENYYEGYSNSIIWPLCHYFFSFIEYKSQYWETYKQVNKIFSQICKLHIKPGDIVWVQDYHLMLLPKMLRGTIRNISIGYFHHIPFPSYELFRVLPERAEILNGLLGADLIAFHTHDYMRHFVSTTERVLDLHFKLDQVQLNNRIVSVDALPMGINYKLYHDAVLNPEVQKKAKELRANLGSSKVILSVDRLDYSKGILHRLRGFSLFLKNHPEYREKVSLAMVIVPSRDQVDKYASLKTSIDKAISEINGVYATINWNPVYYFYHSFSFEELVAMYHIADIALVTPLRDGMNLVAKEYVATQRDTPGVLILSEMAGASIELSDAVIVNPNDIGEIEKAILQALEMPEEEQRRRMKIMQEYLSKHTVNKWVADFLQELESVRKQNEALIKKTIKEDTLFQIRRRYHESDRRLLILDYDGTLAGFKNNPENAIPTKEMMDILERLCNDEKNHIVISSGRDHKTLDRWFGHLNLSLAAEHGAFYKEKGEWHENVQTMHWDEEILDTLQKFVDKTPRSKLEVKETALVWHYREVDAWLAGLREQQLINTLMTPCARRDLQIMRGNKIVEFKSPRFTKGSEARRLLEKGHYDFILAMGDDVTDEDTFHELPKNAFTIMIGSISASARFSLLAQTDVLPFLRLLTQIRKLRFDKLGPLNLISKKKSRINQREVGIGLGKVAELTLGGKVKILAEKPKVIGIRDKLVKQLQSLLFPSRDK